MIISRVFDIDYVKYGKNRIFVYGFLNQNRWIQNRHNSFKRKFSLKRCEPGGSHKRNSRWICRRWSSCTAVRAAKHSLRMMTLRRRITWSERAGWWG